MIKTKSIYEPKNKDDGYRVLVTRYYPRGVKKTHFDIWMRELAPSSQLLKEYKNNEKTWEELIISFKSQLQNSEESIQTMKNLNTKTKSTNITLLCYEKDVMPCHRHLLKEIIREPDLLNADFMLEYSDKH